jgi:uncharacterized protein YggE
MKIVLQALVAAALATSAAAQDDITTRPSIVVVGEGLAEQAPDRFRVSAEVRGSDTTQVEALRALARSQASVTEGLRELEGLETAAITTSGTSVEPVRPPRCNERYDDDGSVDCQITGYLARMSIDLEGSPVERAGDAVSLASERGAQSARLDSFDVSDRAALQARANELAFLDARQQAEAVAAASGQRVTRILRIAQPGARNVGSIDDEGQVEEIVVTGSRMRPTVSLEVAPPPATATARLTVVFEIE